VPATTPVNDPLGQALHDGRLADARVTDEHRVVLATPGQHLDGLLDLLVPSDHRVDTALAGQVGEIAAVLVERGRARAARCLAAGLSGVRGRLGRQTGGGEPGRVQDVPGGRVGIRGQGAQDVLRADVTGAPGPGQVVCVQQGPLGGRGQGQRGGWRGLFRLVLDGAGAFVDLRGEGVGIGTGPAQQGPGRLGGERGPQQVLGVQIPAAVLGGVLGGAPHQLPGRLAQQLADVDLPGAGTRSAEETGEKLSEGVVAFRSAESAGHGVPIRHPRAGRGSPR
jgi:hypothetical protein